MKEMEPSHGKSSKDKLLGVMEFFDYLGLGVATVMFALTPAVIPATMLAIWSGLGIAAENMLKDGDKVSNSRVIYQAA